MLPSDSRPLGHLIRWPLRRIPRNRVIPILSGKLRGKRWITGPFVHSCRLGTYEPLPANLAYLQQHLSLNRVSNVRVVAGAAGENTGTTRFDEGRGRAAGYLKQEGSLPVQVFSLHSRESEGHCFRLLAALGCRFQPIANEELPDPSPFLASHGHPRH